MVGNQMTSSGGANTG